MKNFTMVLLVVAALFIQACNKMGNEEKAVEREQGAYDDTVTFSKRDMAVILSSLPVGEEQLMEVHTAVSLSSRNGFDEEYMMRDLFENPGSGVGEQPSKSANSYSRPLRDLFVQYFVENARTKGSSADVESIVSGLVSSDLQIYWPYSEEWDGETVPVVTFDPGSNAESNYGYLFSTDASGGGRVDSILVDEAVARSRPVWVINSNDDSELCPVEFVSGSQIQKTQTNARKRVLKLNSFKMLRQYDSWFRGASEFRIQMGSVDGFTASTEAELKLYQPSISEFYIIVKRKYVGKDYPFDGIIMTDFTNQLDKLAFLVTEDDGGTKTTWKCSAVVKVNSKSYGFDLEFPYNEKDDVVWRGQIDASFLQTEDYVTGRFGDTMITFELD